MTPRLPPLSSDSASASSATALVSRALRGDLSWIDTEDWDPAAIVRAAEHNGVDLVLWDRLGERGPAALIRQLRGNASREVARAAVRTRELERILVRLSAQGIDTLVLKGAALAHTCYDRPWLRPRVDTDLLVKPVAFEDAAVVLREVGYLQSTSLSTGRFVSHQAAFARTDAVGVPHILDLHWRVLNPQVLAGVVDFEALRREARTIAMGAATMHVPSPLWSLVLACAHRLGHHQRLERLIWVYDVHLLARGFDRSDWGRLIQIARNRQVSAICADGLAAALRHFDTPIPAGVLAELTEAGRSDSSRHYVRGHVRRLDVLRDDLRRLTRWRDRVLLLKEHAFPPVAFMRTRYRSHSSILLPLLYAHRLITGAFKWIRG